MNVSNICDNKQQSGEPMKSKMPVRIQWNLCILCQEDCNNDKLVCNPREGSYQRLLDAIEVRAACNDGNYIEIGRRIQNFTTESLSANKAIWHINCYSETTNKDHIERAKDRYDHGLTTGHYTAKKRGLKRRSTDMDESESFMACSPFTRSCTTPFDKNKCFFCQSPDSIYDLFQVRSVNASNALKDAVEQSDRTDFKTRLGSCIASEDVCSIGLKYHKTCWTKYVFHGKRKTENCENQKCLKEPLLQRAALIDLINSIDIQTQNKECISIEAIETKYIDMLGANGIDNHTPAFSRKWLKEKVLNALPHLTSCIQKDRRKPAIIYSPEACTENMVNSVIKDEENEDKSLQTIYEAAKIIRKGIGRFRNNSKQNAGGIDITSNIDDVPVELYTMLRWVMFGTVKDMETQTMSKLIERETVTVCQNIMYRTRSERQVNYKPSGELGTYRSSYMRDNPHAIGLALTVHHDTRNKTIIDLLNAQGYCVSYHRTLLMETALANAVIENTKLFQGLYVPPFLKKGSFVFFAADNEDFAEDTPDGKGTTQGTVITVNQRADACGELIVKRSSKSYGCSI